MTSEPTGRERQIQSESPPAIQRRPGRIAILGIPVDSLSLAEAVATIQGWVAEAAVGEDTAEASRRLHHVVTVNPEFIVEARRNRAFRSALQEADLSTPDGIGVILAARLLGRRLRGRITGVDLVEGMAEAAAGDPAMRLFLLGAGEGIAARAATALEERFPGCTIAGTWSGSPAETGFDAIRERLLATKPNLLLVAFGH
ncbi:MAG TPA: WecB/TagA/CpsF family glycosyltransferase, partial [Thermomicrobiaceae bacterium]|nr:WecB/TagA/CpsF family glycosyltransferase [Thermomicrobiaceae bacterium]